MRTFCDYLVVEAANKNKLILENVTLIIVLSIRLVKKDQIKISNKDMIWLRQQKDKPKVLALLST